MEERDVHGECFVFFGGTGGIASAAVIEIARRGARILIVARYRKTAEPLLKSAINAGAPFGHVTAIRIIANKTGESPDRRGT